MQSFTDAISKFNMYDIFTYLVDMNRDLAKQDDQKDSKNQIYLNQILQIVEKQRDLNPKQTSKNKKSDQTVSIKENDSTSINVFKLASRNLVIILQSLQSKTYDIANQFLNDLHLDDQNELSVVSKTSIVFLIDLFDHFPGQLGSLISFSTSQIYKILKKDPNISSNLLYLLYSISKNATKIDIDDKLNAKLIKICTKAITQEAISFDLNDEKDNSSILIKKNFILCLKNFFTLSISSRYESLLETSASSNQAGAKLKPETIMSQQHQFQNNLLKTNEKLFDYCLSNTSKEIRVATTDMIASLLINFIPTGEFNSIEFLIRLYPLPDLNLWDPSLQNKLDLDGETIIESRKEKNTVANHDSSSILNSALKLNLKQSSVMSTIIFYIQMEQFQNPEFLSSNLIYILKLILLKFNDSENIVPSMLQVQDTNWYKTLNNWSTLIDYLITETGSAANDILSEFIYSRFELGSESKLDEDKDEFTEMGSLNKEKKKESKIFVFKSSKSNKKRELSSKINIYTNPYQACLTMLIIQVVLPTGINFDSSNNSNGVNEKASSENPEDEDYEIAKSSNDEGSSFLESALLTLIVNDNFYIRTSAIQTFIAYARYNQAIINQLILRIFKYVNQEQKHSEKESKKGEKNEKNVCGITSVRLLSYSLTLSALIRQTDPALLQNSVIVKILSFCTQNLKHSSNTSIKNSSCWIILSSLISLYNSSEYVKLNSSQFLVFWKNLLTSQFLGNTINSDVSSDNEIISNLKLRAFALGCLLNYLNSVELTPESLKQVSFLLSKSYNYLSHLESSIESVGAVTTLNYSSFNNFDYNPNILNNILYSNYSFNNQLVPEKMIISLIFYSKKLIFQSFIRITKTLKSEINSSIVIFLIKIFSDHRLFARETSIDLDKSSKSKSKQPKMNYTLDADFSYLNDEFNYHYGVTSKSTTLFDSENKIKSDNYDANSRLHSVFNMNAQNGASYWLDVFEKTALDSTETSLNYDPNVLITQDLNSHNNESPTLMTSLVDLSIELFQASFPYLTSKIQFSLLEQIRNSLSAKPIDEFRFYAIQKNVSIALFGVALNAVTNNLTFKKDVVMTIIDIIRNHGCKSKEFTSINSKTIGLCSQIISHDDAHGLVTTFVNDIVNNDSPFQRGFAVLSLSQIYSKSKVGFHETYNILSQVISDPNPIMYYYTIHSLISILNSNIEKLSIIPDLLNKISINFLSNAFSYDSDNKILDNLNTRYSVAGPVAQLLRLFVTNLGPALRDWPSRNKTMLRNLIISFSYGIGLATLEDYIQVYKQLMELFQELIIFDPNLIEGEVGIFTNLLNLIISKNLKVAVGNISPTSLNAETIFPFTTSYDLYTSAYTCYYELLKIYGTSILTPETEYLIWVSMNVKPCVELERLTNLWLESSLDKNWFNTLNTLFKSSMKKLVGPFLESNYQQKLLPLSQRQKKNKRDNAVDFKDEENEGIVGGDEDNLEQNEPISWKFKLFIYDSLNNLLKLAYHNIQLTEKLKSKIPDIVKLSFLGSTSTISELKIKGLDVLNSTLELFGEFEDPLYFSVSILEQQQAQIISALIPCFTPGNDFRVIVHAIGVSSNFMNLPRIKFYSKQRILKTLTQLLEEISSNKFLKFGFLESMSEFGKKSIQLAILNCWAILRIDSNEKTDGSSDEEFKQILEKYSKLLVSLWIMAIREYSVIKYSESTSKEMEIYGTYWINLINVLSLESNKNEQLVNDLLSGEAQNFYFILFSQCMESLVKNRNVVQVLHSTKKLLRIHYLVDLIFTDQIFIEIVDIFDRLVLIDDNTEVQCLLLENVNILFQTFISSHPTNLETGFDRLFELIRITMLPLFRILPFLKTDYEVTDEFAHENLLKHAESAANLLVLKKAFDNLVEMISLFPKVVKMDLYSCLLYIFAKVYATKKIYLISVILPHLKQILIGINEFNNTSVTNFFNIIKNYYEITPQENYTIITTVVLLTYGAIELDVKNSKKLSESLLSVLSDSNSASLSLQCIKSLIQSNKSNVQPVLNYLLSDILRSVSGFNEKLVVDKKLSIEILIMYTKVIKNDLPKSRIIYSIIIPVLANNEGKCDDIFIHQKLMYLVKLNPAVFKEAINNHLTKSQREKTEKLMKMKIQTDNQVEDTPAIELRTFV
ncbi:uncharacterized protein KGF55_002519 [Candida pseudojiufengensis]|uniref:uncharacterized protein n=1 Tax=Candida pseudojiufengensis TaxID=497109 RepID=UPI0022243B30|nr:uncharacterized protein KGF55_002519 [Candida pseudojiufengensis]KAI5963639.1 hypothetical protein KGF55_002519 [Candida pseudojiufengensis]